MIPWQQAWQEALYGEAGFYRNQLPSGHFRTASHVAPDLLAEALLALCDELAVARLVEVGPGDGELLTALAATGAGLDLVGVELRPRPPGLPEEIDWRSELPGQGPATLLLGWELLDVVPTTLAEFNQYEGDGCWSRVLVDATGAESIDDGLTIAELQWLQRWRPNPHLGECCEIGLTRESFWLNLIEELKPVAALAVDYGLDPSEPGSTLTGFRDGRQAPPVPDGSSDLTAHVRFDSLAAALHERGWTIRTDPQHAWLRHYGPPALTPPPVHADPHGYLHAVAANGRRAELLDPDGLGGFTWLLASR